MVQRDANGESWGNDKDLEKRAKGKSLLEDIGGHEQGSSLTPSLGQFPQVLWASSSPSVTGGVVIPTSQPSTTCSVTPQHLLRPSVSQVLGGLLGVEEGIEKTQSLPPGTCPLVRGD